MSVPSQEMVFHRRKSDSRATINSAASKELIFAVVGPVGSGTSFVATALAGLAGSAFGEAKVVPIKASAVIAEATEKAKAGSIPNTENKLERARALQDAGDSLRERDHAAVGSLIVAKIKVERVALNTPQSSDVPYIKPEEKEEPTCIYIIDSLKHPAEVHLLRAVYREAFCLVGVVCEEKTRKSRLQNNKCKKSGSDEIDLFMRRDESATDKWGQKVSDTFHMADFFVDNTPERTIDGLPNKDWVVTEKLGRLFDILSGKKIVRPEASETGMFHAAGAQMRSACLSRQVGAAIVDGKGNLISTGTNEVPKSGGGVYGGDFLSEGIDDVADHRCSVSKGYCSNTKHQYEIIDEVINAIPALRNSDKSEIERLLKKTSLGRLLEFSRAVHAEMDALLSAARTGASTVDTKLFVTTFPCHYCARHIVAAGVNEVQYIEPYPKSKAFELHGDSIEQIFTKWFVKPPQKPTKVLFRPFTGVAPRLYGKAFLKRSDLKDEKGVLLIGEPDWAPGLLQKSYLQIEELLEGDHHEQRN